MPAGGEAASIIAQGIRAGRSEAYDKNDHSLAQRCLSEFWGRKGGIQARWKREKLRFATEPEPEIDPPGAIRSLFVYAYSVYIPVPRLYAGMAWVPLPLISDMR